MSKVITIYCEGKKGSHDFDVLDKVIADLPNIQIEPIGGVRGANAIIKYREEGGLVVKSDFYIFFRDRDFDRNLPENVCLETEKNICFSYRNTIENYLFSPAHIFNFITQKCLSQKYLIIDEETAKQKLIEAAERIRVYQAIRHTMGNMRTDKTNFGTKLTDRDKSGILPDSLDKDVCIKQALEKISKAKGLADNWTEEKFHKILNTFLAKFDEEFMQNLDFLCYFHGKDLAKSFSDILPDFPIKSYYKFAKEHLDYKQFTDLVELRNLIENNV